MPKSKTDKDWLRDAQDVIRRKNEELAELRRENRDLYKQNLEREREFAEHYAIANYDPTPPAWVMSQGGVTGKRGGPVVQFSDWHIGEVVNPDELGGQNSFNKNIAPKRVKRLTETVIDLAFNHMGRAKTVYPGIVVPLNGDFVGGENHEELMATNDLPIMDAAELATDLLAASIDNLATKFGRVFCPCEPGNHGRTTRKPRFKQYVQTNHDYGVYRSLAKHFRGSKHIRFLISPEADVAYNVYGTRFLQTHGDNLGSKGGDGIIGAMGPIMRGWTKLVRQKEEFDYLMIGHWHQTLWLPSVICNNALKGHDEYAQLKLRAPARPASQSLFFVHPDRGITARWEVFVDGSEKAREAKDWVSWR